ncbi:MAG TPA: S8 family serine peptidase, partial [Pyrinomonadaceae bacterium]
MKKALALVVFAGLCVSILVSPPSVSSNIGGKKGVGVENAKLRKNANKIENNYIVVLDDSVVGEKGIFSIAPYIASELALTHRGKLKHTYQHALNGFAVEMSPEDAERLSQDFRVAFVEEDGVVTADATQSNPPWGLDRIDQRNRPLNGIYTF